MIADKHKSFAWPPPAMQRDLPRSAVGPVVSSMLQILARLCRKLLHRATFGSHMGILSGYFQLTGSELCIIILFDDLPLYGYV